MLEQRHWLALLPLIFLGSCAYLPTSDKDESEKGPSFTESLNDRLVSTFDLENSELEIEVKEDNFDTDFRLKTVSSISEGDDGSYWLNQSNLSRQDDDTTVNLGIIYRKLSEDEKSIFGVNVFYDHEFPRNHQRTSIGIERLSKNFDLSANIYSAISSDKTKGSVTERAMDGFDYEIGIPAPYLPSSRLYIGGYSWDGNNYDIKSGVTANLETQINNRITANVGLEDNNRLTSSRLTGKVAIALGPVEAENVSRKLISSRVFEADNGESQSDRVYDFVRRQNRIVKTVSGSVTVGRGT